MQLHQCTCSNYVRSHVLRVHVHTCGLRTTAHAQNNIRSHVFHVNVTTWSLLSMRKLQKIPRVSGKPVHAVHGPYCASAKLHEISCVSGERVHVNPGGLTTTVHAANYIRSHLIQENVSMIGTLLRMRKIT